ncbi:Non-specific lipid-transfer protein 2 [Euphorbia peplus]|nr:Non-specific lipid-transfer protein 2 [Euphorbia peplus]
MKKIWCGIIVCVVVIMGMEVGVSRGVKCSPVELAMCLPAIAMSEGVSRLCCRKMREQRPCYCGYLKDPNIKLFIASNIKLGRQCGVAFPTC